MKTNWILTSVIAASLGGLVTYLLTRNWKLALIGALLIFVLMLINNPKRRYMKAFWTILSLILVLNQFFFRIVGEIFGIQFEFENEAVGDIVTVCLIVLAAITLFLDYLERGGKLKGTFLSFQKNKIGNIKGNNITINQHIQKDSPQQDTP